MNRDVTKLVVKDLFFKDDESEAAVGVRPRRASVASTSARASSVAVLDARSADRLEIGGTRCVSRLASTRFLRETCRAPTGANIP